MPCTLTDVPYVINNVIVFTIILAFMSTVYNSPLISCRRIASAFRLNVSSELSATH